MPWGNNYYITGTVTLGIWAKKAGAWAMVTTTDVFIYQDMGNVGGQQTVNWSTSASVDMGPGVQAFGVTVEGYSGIGATVADFVSASWTATASSGERSATPSGQQSTVTVTPQ